MPETQNDTDRLIDTADALRILGCSKTTLYRYEAASMLTSKQYVEGGKKRWRLSEVQGLRGVEPTKQASEAERRRAARRGLPKSA